MSNFNLAGQFFEQYLTEDDINASEKEAVRLLKQEQNRKEVTELITKLNAELDRLFEKRYTDLGDLQVFATSDGRVGISLAPDKIAKAFDITIISIRPYASVFDTGRIGVKWPTQPGMLHVEGSTHTAKATMSIHVKDKDFDSRMQMIFKLAKAHLKLKPMIRGA